MSISVRCPGCDKMLRVSDSKRGKRVKCPVCAQAVPVPDQEEEELVDEEFDTPAPLRKSKPPRKKKSAQNMGLGIPIGIGVSIVVLFAAAVGLREFMKKSGRPTIDASVQNPNPVSSDQNIAMTSPPIAPEASPAEPSTAETPAVQSMAEDRDDDDTKPTAEKMSASDDFFNQGMIPDLRIEIAEPDIETLRAGPKSFVIGSPRPYVEATITENGTTVYQNVAIKLKGSAGSFRPVDDRPALTVNVAKYEKDQAFHGMGKFHLNNSVQDPTYMNEWLCSELFLGAKIPATRVSHARVWLNNRDLGLYVLKSAFDKSFLQRHFRSAKGNLYEGGFVQDININLEKDLGKGPDDHSDLAALLAACRDPNAEGRWKRLEELLDLDQFISFMAMELMTGHWDGYTTNHNNYRLYFEAKSNKAHFIPHGMDQVFGDGSIIDYPSSIVSSVVMQNAEWRTRYRERVGEFLQKFSPAEELNKRVDMLNERLSRVLTLINPQAARDHESRVKQLKERLIAHADHLVRQHSQPDPRPKEFDESGRLLLTDWRQVSESPDAKLDLVDLPKGIKAYSIQCGPKSPCNSSWRCKTLLAKGTYVFHANLKSDRINAKDEKNQAVGAGIYISGTTRSNVRKGTVSWTPVEFEFTVQEDLRNVEFIAELRARKGQVWYDAAALHLTRKSPN